MGRHGTGGSENERQRGNFWSDDPQEEDFRSATDPAATWSVPQDPITTGAFWAPEPGPAGEAEQPGWPMPPDQIETTGQWAPQPRPAAQESIPETTGAFAIPPSQPFDQPPVDQPSFGGPPSQPDIFGETPAPGDIKVYGEPTVVEGRMPAWADAETSFLASGWSSGEEEPEDDQSPRRRRRGRRRPPPRDEWSDRPTSGGKTRLALLGVAAVAIVLGGTVAGVRLMGSSEDPAGPSAATQSAPPISEAPVEETEEPTEEPVEEDTAAAPSPTVSTQGPRRSANPTPTPTKTKTKATTQPTEDPEPTPTESSTPEPTESQTALTDDDSLSEPTTGTTTVPEVTPTIDNQSGGAAGPSVNVQLDEVKQRWSGYTAELRVVNDSAKTLSNLTVSVPVGGDVFDVKGADWTQDGDLLILDLGQAVESGGVVTLTVSASGSAAQPETCGLVGGSCAVS